MSKDKDDPVLEVLKECGKFLEFSLRPKGQALHSVCEKAIAIQKAQAIVIHEVRGFVLGEWGSTQSIEKALAALDELTKEGK